jgi:hypothetical protein
MQAPAWLPYRIRHDWDNARIRWSLRGLGKTRPRPATPLEDADAEAHMLLCRRDAGVAVLALKSLLRFGEARFAVTLTSDASLTEDQRRWIDHHVPGCRWLPRRVSDPRLEQYFLKNPRMRALYAGGYHPLCKLLHAALLSRKERVLVYDPDTAFFRKPDRILRWARGEDPHALYLHDHQDERIQVPPETRAAFTDLAKCCTPPGRHWQMDYYFFNSGLLAFRPDQLRLDLAERYLEWRVTAPREYLVNKPGLWFGDWTPEQTAYQIMFAVMDPPSQPLGDDYHLGGDPGHAFNHFLRHYLVKPASLRMLRDLIAQL